MDAVDIVIDRLYDGTTEPEAWTQALAGLCELTGADHLLTMVQDSAMASFPLVASVRIEPSAMDRFVGVAAGCIAMIQNFDERRSFDFQSVVPRSQFLRSDLFHDVIRPMGGYRALLSVPFRQGAYDSFIAVCRPAKAEEFGAAETAMLDRLVPHVTRAMRVKIKLDHAAQRVEAALGAFDRLAVGMAIVDTELRVVVVNRRGEQMIAQRDGLVLSSHALAAASPAGTSWLQLMVQRAASDDPRTAGSYTLRLERRSSGPPWQITAKRLASGGGSGRRLVALMIEETERTVGDVSPVLISTYGFTAREAALAVALANGNDLAASAGRLGISIGTARNYLKSIFVKTGTRRQAELVAVLLRAIRFA